MKDWKLPSVGTMLLVYVLILAIFDEPNQLVETPFDESLSASEESKKMQTQIEERHRAITTEIFNKQWRASKMKFKRCTCYIDNIILWNGR